MHHFDCHIRLCLCVRQFSYFPYARHTPTPSHIRAETHRTIHTIAANRLLHMRQIFSCLHNVSHFFFRSHFFFDLFYFFPRIVFMVSWIHIITRTHIAQYTRKSLMNLYVYLALCLCVSEMWLLIYVLRLRWCGSNNWLSRIRNYATRRLCILNLSLPIYPAANASYRIFLRLICSNTPNSSRSSSITFRPQHRKYPT